ncbi:hypothetical protein KP509_14G030200 [Ceratopteris richardii]|uniref:Uncharacterized protein n=1 Tax=Ceratopteris richardii TaxID=49495 RepID=A0A8T2T873_CERRI|nr:hypothetical protein KP509_14G030200 [Ceratopteris richardii]KAH7415150.1 hypothetical protein KP509_14G030200 [Ceratopteris richardii]
MEETCERDVVYSCGFCGYPLNLSSSQRVVSGLTSRALRKQTISFLCIDESRFQQVEEIKCAPRLQPGGFLKLNELRTKFLCGNCRNVIGHGHLNDKSVTQQVEISNSSPGPEAPQHKKYCMKIKALQPSLDIKPTIPAAD